MIPIVKPYCMFPLYIYHIVPIRYHVYIYIYSIYTLWETNSLLLNMATEIVDPPSKIGDVPYLFVCLPEANNLKKKR